LPVPIAKQTSGNPPLHRVNRPKIVVACSGCSVLHRQNY